MERVRGIWDDAKASFGAIPALALVAGVALGILLPYLDEWLAVDLPVVEFASQDAARSVLETIATVTVSVAGLAFSVTVVALTLSSSQLSPRVLRTFQGDRLSQVTLAWFLGTFIYCVVGLLRLGETQDDGGVPNLTVTVAALMALAAFGLFAWFLHHIVRMLQPATVIRRIELEAADALAAPYPAGVPHAPEDVSAAEAAAAELRRTLPGHRVLADGSGYVTQVRGAQLVHIAAHHGGIVVQAMPVGDYVVPGDLLATLHVPGEAVREDAEGSLLARVGAAFELGEQRSALQDGAFPVRQLADIALKGLSPSVNDPTTAQNAMEALAAALVRFAAADRPPLVRVDGDGAPRLVAIAPTLDDLVRLGFEQVRVSAAEHPVVSIRLLELLERIGRAARRHGLEPAEVARQARLVRDGSAGEVPGEGDAEAVRVAHERLHGDGAAGGVSARAHVARESAD